MTWTLYRLSLGFAALIVALWLGGCAEAQTRVDLELVMAVDISLSMDYDELKLQRGGYATAFRDPELQRAIVSGPSKRIAVAYFEWAGRSVQRLIVDWMVIDGAASAHAFADALERAPISRERMTSISAAIDYASQLFDQSTSQSLRRVLDISGDGPNNNGRPVTVARDALLHKGVAINGLPLVLKSGSTVFDIVDLDLYYTDCVIGGPAAFSIPVRSETEFVPNIRRKLLLEIAYSPPARVQRAQVLPTPEPRIDCMIGEQLWRRYMDGRNPN